MLPLVGFYITPTAIVKSFPNSSPSLGPDGITKRPDTIQGMSREERHKVCHNWVTVCLLDSLFEAGYSYYREQAQGGCLTKPCRCPGKRKLEVA